MYTKKGIGINTLKGKLKIFSEFYEELYKNVELQEESIDRFLDNMVIPSVAQEHR